jgi:hypothetical protein
MMNAAISPDRVFDTEHSTRDGDGFPKAGQGDDGQSFFTAACSGVPRISSTG